MRTQPRSPSVYALLAVFLLGPAQGLAYEVDNFTGRAALTEDALPILDRKVNEILERAVRAANRESPGHCNRVLLRQEIVRWTGPDPVSILELWSAMTGKVQQSRADMSESIYAGVSLSESPAMWVAGIGRSFRLAGQVVGTDKLGHFFMQGLTYYKKVAIDGVDLNFVLKEEHSEDGLFGLSLTGVKSYADMAANYQGYLFWKNLYEGNHPYVRCENDEKWVKLRTFTWKDYVSPAWDEAINCSEMKPKLAARVIKNRSKLGLRCPVEPMGCVRVSRLEKSEYFTSPVCQVIAKNFLSDTLTLPAQASARVEEPREETSTQAAP